jgi:DNA polymerase
VAPLRVHLDFETRCAIDLRQHGLARYVAHPSFEVLLTAVAVGDAPVKLYRGFPRAELVALSELGTFHAFNARFEQAVCESQNLYLPDRQWHCTMVRAYQLGFSGGLAAVGAQLGLDEDKRKRADGSRLVAKFCSPRRAGRTRSDPWWTSENAPEDWERFELYCMQDVETERIIERALRFWAGPESEYERRLWAMDCRIDRRGMPVDVPLISAALGAGTLIADGLDRRVREIAGLSPAQTGKLLQWCQERGYPGDALSAESIQEFLSGELVGTEDPLLSEVLRLRLQASQSAVAKYNKLADTMLDGRAHGMLQLRGAGRTGRFAGRGVQLQNLKRPALRDVDGAVALLLRDPRTFAAIYSLGDLGSLVRSAFAAGPGKQLVVADLANIESRVLGMLCRMPRTQCRVRRGARPVSRLRVRLARCA